MNWKWLKRRIGLTDGTVLALSGGGARGLAHIGVLQEFDRLGLKPDLVTGTSIGAIVGAMYCLHGSAAKLEEITRKTIESEHFKDFDIDEMLNDDEDDEPDSIEQFGARLRRAYTLTKMVRKQSMIEPGVMEAVMGDMFGDATFEDCKIPFAAVATDLISGEDITLREGSLATAVQASASIPGVFAPVEYDGMLLVDGYVTRNVPIPEPDEPEVDASIIVVDVTRDLYFEGPYKRGIDILSRTDWIMQIHLNRFYLEKADLVIVPDVRSIHWAEFKKMQPLIEAGRYAARVAEEKILRLFA